MAKQAVKAEKPAAVVTEQVEDLRDPNDWRHNTAAYVHGWAEHAHHAGEPMRMTAEDYTAALEAIDQPFHLLAPHKAAMSPHKGKGI